VQIYVPLFGFLAYLSYTVIQRSWQRTLALWASLTAIALVGPSRVHAGEHWPSDVLAGYFFGSLWLWLTVKLYRLGKPVGSLR
jgi:undecaprenyl-diphosphatase